MTDEQMKIEALRLADQYGPPGLAMKMALFGGIVALCHAVAPKPKRTLSDDERQRRRDRINAVRTKYHDTIKAALAAQKEAT